MAYIAGVSVRTVTEWVKAKKVPVLRENSISRFHVPSVLAKKTKYSKP